MGVDKTGGSDTRTETTDKPTPQERPSGPPPDNPGSPGQPSRLESLARARREQQKNGPQQTEAKETGTDPAEVREHEPASPQTGSGELKAEGPGKPETEDKEPAEGERSRDHRGPEAGQSEQRDGRETEPRSQDSGTATSETETGTPGDRDRPRPAEQHADTRTEPADRPTSPERRWTPPPDNPGSPGQPSRLESRARAREQQQAAAAQRNEAGDGREPSAELNTEPAADTSTQDGESVEQRTSDIAPFSPEEPAPAPGAYEPHGDRGRNPEEPENLEPEGHKRLNFTSHNPPGDRTHYTVSLDEISRSKENTNQSMEVEGADSESSPYSVPLVEFTRASTDPHGTDIEPGAASKSLDRQEQTEGEPESRIDRARRATWMRGGDLKNAGTTLSDTANGILGPRPPAPTGHAESGRGPYITPPDSPWATPDAFVATATTAMLIVEGAKKAKEVGSRMADRIKGGDHDSNR